MARVVRFWLHVTARNNVLLLHSGPHVLWQHDTLCQYRTRHSRGMWALDSEPGLERMEELRYWARTPCLHGHDTVTLSASLARYPEA
eukprot:2555372-Rhodomonas_salina.2